MRSTSRLTENEWGMVSILVTMIMMIVITLIVLSFAEVSRRNQQAALDSQLSTQAFYAAESGVNAAVRYLTQAANIGAGINTIGSCTRFMTKADISGMLDTSSNTQYTCLMVDTEPSTLSVAPLTQNNSQVMYFGNTDNEPFTQLKFSWSPESNSPFATGACEGSGSDGVTLPAYGSWNCPYGILRMDLTDASSVSRASLDSGRTTASFYLIPSYNSGSAFLNAADVSWPPHPADPSVPANTACNADGDDCPVRIIPVACSAAGCSLRMDITGGSTGYYARLTMMYQDAGKLTIAGGDATDPISSVTGVGANFTGGQALIDSTGQSQDELRRIQVRIPLSTPTGIFPAYGLQTTQSICKQIEGGPGLYTDNCPGHP